MRKIGFFLLTLAAVPALAEWVEVAPADQDPGTFYIDPATIDSFGASMRWAWQMQDLKKAGGGWIRFLGRPRRVRLPRTTHSPDANVF